jgi:short-subunit dehydrogenase
MPKSQTTLITGATSGIGRYAALHLARRGHRVIASGRRPDALADLSAEAGSAGLDLATVRLDVTDRTSIADARGRILELTDGRGVDALINNAGYGHAGPMSEVSDADLRAQYDTNVFGLMAVTRAFLPEMIARRAGRIVNVSSVGGRLTLPFFGAYNSTKYAVESMSDALRLELAPLGVRVVLIEPGIIRSNFADRSLGIADRYGDADNPFAPAVQVFQRATEASDRLAVSPRSVARAMARAIERRRPAARYIAPFRTTLMLALYKLMPTRVNDWFFRRVSGLTARKLLPAPTEPELLRAPR